MKLRDLIITEDHEVEGCEGPLLYLRLTGNDVQSTTQISGRVNIDVDAAGDIVGIEVI